LARFQPFSFSPLSSSSLGRRPKSYRQTPARRLWARVRSERIDHFDFSHPYGGEGGEKRERAR
jgi:hypothetical protein